MNEENVLPNRKPNRLKEYDYSTAGAYFITICTKDKRCILGKIVGDDAHIVPQIKLSKFGKTADKYLNNINGIDKYCIMPNHIHLIIKIICDYDGAMWASPPTTHIPQLIKSFKILTTKEIGKSIFQRSYYDHIIRSEDDYKAICKYIDENPSKWLYDDLYIDF